MRKLYTFAISILFVSCTFGQEFATFTLTGVHQGTGTFNNAVLPDFNWVVDGTLTGEVQILDDEVFEDGNAFEDIFGQADLAQNLRIQVIPNGAGTSGQPISSHATLTMTFNANTPSFGWGFCLVDIDVENAIISATDQFDNPVSNSDIDDWMVELFDANLTEDGVNLPKWDAENSAVLGSDTPPTYTTYNNLVIGGMPSSEAPAVAFFPDLSLNSLVVEFESLQENYNTSYHFYIASLNISGINDHNENDLQLCPNPAINMFKVQPRKNSGNLSEWMPMAKVGGATLEIIDLGGRKLIEKDIPAGTDDFEVDVSGLESGIYCCRIYAGEFSITEKLVIK